MTPADTKIRILDAAELIFAKAGFDGASVRAITAEAQVNLAAVHYHFQSKEALFEAVLARRVNPINQRRHQMLDALEAEFSPEPIPAADVLDALLTPVLEESPSLVHMRPLMATVHTLPGSFMHQAFWRLVGPTLDRFLLTLRRSLPHLEPADVMWRLMFSIGALAHVMLMAPLIAERSGGLCDPHDIPGLRRRLINFVSAGVNQPAIQEAVPHA
jgi:AcrR family transcriptional regulator